MQKTAYFLFLGIFVLIFSSFSGCQKKEKYINGLKASAIYPTFQKQGFQLDSGETMMWRKLHRWNVYKPSKEIQTYNIFILGDTDNEVFEVEAKAQTNDVTEDTKAFFSALIKSLNYTNAKPTETEKWVLENLGKNAEYEAGGVNFQLYKTNEGKSEIGLKVHLKENKR
jgi:ribosomal protein L23